MLQKLLLHIWELSNVNMCNALHNFKSIKYKNILVTTKRLIIGAIFVKENWCLKNTLFGWVHQVASYQKTGLQSTYIKLSFSLVAKRYYSSKQKHLTKLYFLIKLQSNNNTIHIAYQIKILQVIAILQSIYLNSTSMHTVVILRLM